MKSRLTNRPTCAQPCSGGGPKPTASLVVGGDSSVADGPVERGAPCGPPVSPAGRRTGADGAHAHFADRLPRGKSLDHEGVKEREEREGETLPLPERDPGGVGPRF